MSKRKTKITRGYKAFDENMQCNGFQFRVGKTYTHTGRIVLCKSGFHFCENLPDVFVYYPRSSRVCEVVAYGRVKSDGSKSVCSKIKIAREMHEHEIQKRINTGNWNTGKCNTGNWNAGNWNTGDFNTGDWNAGNWNTGDFNTGDRNTGNWNAGNWNTGDFNTGDRNTGVFCTEKNPKIKVFDAPSDMTWSDYRNTSVYSIVMKIRTAESVSWDKMTAKERRSNPEAKTTGGIVRVYTYHQAWSNLWATLSAAQRGEFAKLPNFNAEKFREITGISFKKNRNRK